MSTSLYTVIAEELGFILIACLKVTTSAERQTFIVKPMTTITLDNDHIMKSQFASQPLFSSGKITQKR